MSAAAESQAPAPPPPTPADTRPWLSLSESAHAAGCARITIRRALDAGRFPQAKRADGPGGPGSGGWLIPVTDLLAAGFRLGRPAPPESAEPVSPNSQIQAPDTPDELARLRAEIAGLRRRAELAEALAAERGRHLEDLRLALRALPAAPEPARLGWWQRRRAAQSARTSG